MPEGITGGLFCVDLGQFCDVRLLLLWKIDVEERDNSRIAMAAAITKAIKIQGMLSMVSRLASCFYFLLEFNIESFIYSIGVRQ